MFNIISAAFLTFLAIKKKTSKDRKSAMNIELYWENLFNNPQSKEISEMTASQLPGRQNGGAADAYRHILLKLSHARLIVLTLTRKS